MKKFIALLLVAVMCFSLGIGGTLAYLTDRETETNVFTVGDVDIELTENFIQGSELLPGVDVIKDVKVKNIGDNDAWVWVTIALPSELDNDDASKNVLHFNYTPESVGTGFWNWKNEAGNWMIDKITYDGIEYNRYSVLYQTALKPGETTKYSAMSKLYLDTHLDIDPEGNWYRVENGTATEVNWNTNTNGAPKMLVAAYAIQKDANITTVQDAYAKYVGQWGELNAEYVAPVVVETSDELKALVAQESDGKVVFLKEGTYKDLSFINPANYKAKNLTIIGEEGAVIDGYSINGWSADNNIVIDGLTFNNVTFSKGLLLSTKEMSNVTVVGCDFINDACIIQNDKTEHLDGLVIKDCNFTGDMNGNTTAIMLESTKNVTVTGSTFTNIDFNVMQAGIIDGKVLFDNNKINGTGDRVFRFVYMNADMTISNNTIVSNGDDKGELAKATDKCQIALINNTWNGKTDEEVANKLINITSSVVKVSDDTELSNAIASGASTVVLGSGDYIIPASAQNKTLTIVGNGEDTSVAVTKVGTDGENCDYGLDGSTVTFENITITTNSSTYIGYARCNGTYNNCTINGTYTLYGDSVFNNCTFNVTGDVYNIWTWGAEKATFNNCTFNSDGKALLLYGTVNTKLTVNNCVFNDKGGLPDLKAAIEIGNDYNKSYELIVNNTTVNGYEINDKGIVTDTTLWANKNSMGQDKLNVVVDGVDVY